MNSDAEWIASAMQGDRTAFGHLVRAHTPVVSAITLSITRNVAASEDVAQDVFLLAWTRLHQLKNPDSFGAWLRQLSRNRSLEALRARRRLDQRVTLSNEAVTNAVSWSDPAGAVLDAEEQVILNEVLEALPDNARETLVLYYREGQSTAHVARLLEVSEATVRKRLSRARELLRGGVETRFAMVVNSCNPGPMMAIWVLERLGAQAVPAPAGWSVAAKAVIGTTGLAVVLGGLVLASRGPEMGDLGHSPPDPANVVATPTSPDTAPVDPSDVAPERASDPTARSTQSEVAGVNAQATYPEIAVDFDGEGHVYAPVWSSDGHHVAFEVNQSAGNIDLYFAEISRGVAQTAKRVSLPGGASGFGSGGQVVVNPSWHPQGIAVFEGSNQGGEYRLYFAQPGGALAAEMLPASLAPGNLTFPAISPDGNLMAFVSAETGNGDIRMWDRGTNALTQLTTTSESEKFPTFAKNGTDLLFTRDDGNEEDVYELVGGVEELVAGGPNDQTRPAYAADGHIVFFESSTKKGDPARKPDSWAIGVVKNGVQTVLVEGVRLPLRARPALSPDGQWVAYTYKNPAGSSYVEIQRVDGSATHRVPTTLTACGEPAMTEREGHTLLALTGLRSDGSEWRALSVVDVSQCLSGGSCGP